MNDAADKRARLGAWLREQPAFGTQCEVRSLAPLAGGQSSELFKLVCRTPLDQADAAYVIRFEQRGKQLFLTPDIVREFRVIDGVARHSDVPVAPMMAVEASGVVLGTPFLVMRLVGGRSPLGRPSMHSQGLLTELTAQQRRTLAFNGLDAMAGIHAIDWRRSHAFLNIEGERKRGIDRHLQQIADWYAWAADGRTFPLTDQALDYLLRTRGSLRDDRDVLLWGDARPGNILFAEDQAVAAVLDWEGALIGPRGLDVGYWIMMDSFHSEMIGIQRLPGWPSTAEVVERYRTISGYELNDLDYYIVLGALFMATTLIRATDIAIAAGRLPAATQMAHANTTTQIIAERLGLNVPPLSPDFVAHRALPPGFTGRS
ncbi:MAG: phosphotransferase family protein [Sphingopyxis sp.]|uniref:phosphotransferase family protein n=1 Tax=Sphingopyxis sp. TaxID=1908224 RepID=UPI001A32F58B|nr:phosphotransferase family protein [Sphingopyxis sp.]MBJ7499333.1 phosphotransferase family protein [Sphingopyxis sp.]